MKQMKGTRVMGDVMKQLVMFVALVVCVVASGCTTTEQGTGRPRNAVRRAGPVRPPTSDPAPSTVRFAEFAAVEMKHTTIAPDYAGSDANQRALKKIDENLFASMRQAFPALKEVGAEASPTSSGIRTLLIEPEVEAIRFIGGGARFWVGAMAGNSAVRLKLVCRDKATGQIIADPVFYRESNAWAGGMSVGGADNVMLKAVTEDASGYAILNR